MRMLERNDPSRVQIQHCRFTVFARPRRQFSMRPSRRGLPSLKGKSRISGCKRIANAGRQHRRCFGQEWNHLVSERAWLVLEKMTEYRKF